MGSKEKVDGVHLLHTNRWTVLLV